MVAETEQVFYDGGVAGPPVAPFKFRVRIWPHRLAGFASAVLGVASCLFGAEAQPAVGPGANREEVLQTYGWPTGQSRLGAREILNYPQGRVTLEDDRVQRVDFSAKLPWPAPRPRPAAASPVSGKKAEASVDLWIEDFGEAVGEATSRGGQILALFTGRDWSPASRRFHEQVATHPEFVDALADNFVFLRLDFPTRVPLAPKLREQNDRLRATHGVTVYPTLLVLSAAGEALAMVDLSPPAAEAYRARVIAAIQAERARLPAPAAEMVLESSEPVEAAPLPTYEGWTRAFITENLGLSLTEMFVAVLIVVTVASTMLWLLRRTSAPTILPPGAVAVRLSNTAGGVPTLSEISTWSREKVCAVTAALAESEGYIAEVMPFGSEKDLLLKNGGETEPRVVVFCAAGDAGAVPARRLRALKSTLIADGAKAGWFVSPNGFASDAQAYAEQHRLHLIDASRLLARIRELPPLLLPKALPREAVRKAA